jgi:pimeloyl-ACP methyl ester carboxylesterase
MQLSDLIEKYTNEYSKFININGLDVHYRDEGKGEVLLLIHGTFSSLHTFDDWTEILKNHFRVIRLDLPGFGITGPSNDNKYSIELFTDFIMDFLDAIKVKKFNIAGNSLGGWMSWELALICSKRIKKMILLNSAGYINDRDYPLPFVIAQTPFLRNAFSFIPRAVVRRFLRQVYCDQASLTDDIVNRYYDLIHREGNLDAFVKIANSYFIQNTHKLNMLKLPVLIIWGEKDRWINPKHAQYFHRDLPSSTLLIYENVGHVPMEEIPEKSALDVINFLKN